MEKFSILLIIAAIACALFSDKMDLAEKSDFRIQCGGIISLHNYIDCAYPIVNIQTEKLHFIEESPI